MEAQIRDDFLAHRGHVVADLNLARVDGLEDRIEAISAASHESQKLDDLMADLIVVAEIDVGKRELTLEKLSPFPMLREARDRYCDQAAEKHINIEINAYADLSFVHADRRAFRSILDNLLSNAVRFTPEGGEILLTAEEVKDFVQFTVRDSGRGIEAFLPTYKVRRRWSDRWGWNRRNG